MVSQWIRLIECNYFEITIFMITLDSRVITIYLKQANHQLTLDYNEDSSFSLTGPDYRIYNSSDYTL